MPDKDSLPAFLKEEDIARWTGYWYSRRRVLLTGEINGGSFKKAMFDLAKLDYEKVAPITLMIESGGGRVTTTHQLEDVIGLLNSPVDALMIGSCASMAIDLMQMCRRRLMLPSSRILIHYVRNEQLWVCDDIDQLETDFKYFIERQREVEERRITLYQKRTNLSKEKLKELFRQGEVHQAYFSAKQAIKLGFADEIVTDFKLFPKDEE